ncbi:MAG TPA: pitrilysin family protein [Bdellovibrionota bacterium]|nr:pitrilysin family protein [Bdellovibrionota bacterium]
MSKLAGGYTLALLLASFSVQAAQGILPYKVYKRTLPNQLDVIVIPMPQFPKFLSYNTLVLTGSLREMEPGQTGKAHLFEHILFRHEYQGKPGGYEDAMTKTGAYNNAYTNSEVTFYHPKASVDFLTQIVELEADRFKNLRVDKDTFKTETGAVAGEYQRFAKSPELPLEETLASLAYPANYGYGHTTIGYAADIQAMPETYASSMDFYRRYYRPNNVVILVSGDVNPEQIFHLIEEHYSDWKPAPLPPLTDPGTVNGPLSKALHFPTAVPPRIWINFRMQPFQIGSSATAVGQILPTLIAHPTAPLYRKLRYEKQVAADVSCSARGDDNLGYETFGPGMFTVSVTLFPEKFKKQGDRLLHEVQADVISALESLKSFSKRPDAADFLARLKQNYRMGMANRLDSPADVAEEVALYSRFSRDPMAIDHLVGSVRRVKPPDIDHLAQQIFVPENQIVLTLAHQDSPADGKGE